jgi:hypothetical protein
METTAQRLAKLNIKLPKPTKCSGLYRQAFVDRDRLIVSAHGTHINDLPNRKLRYSFDAEAGKRAAYEVGLAVLATVEATVGLENVNCLVKTLGQLNAAPDFAFHDEVMDGFSQLMIDFFGNVNGLGSRSTIGVSSPPLNKAVQVQCEFRLFRPMYPRDTH